jgi:hypothetical protein
MNGIESLDQYMEAYGPLLGRQAQRSLSPLHIPGRDKLPPHGLNRAPFEPQAHVIEAIIKTWNRQKAAWLVAEMGTGKTIMAIGAVNRHARGPYNALVFCPGQLVRKWEREIRETIHGARVVQLEDWRDVVALTKVKPSGRTWYIIARDRAKLGAKWRPAANKIEGQPWLRCPTCGGRLVDERSAALEMGDLGKRRMRCEQVLNPDGGVPLDGCCSPLWQYTSELWRWEPAKYIHKHLRRFFTYLVLDEVHEEKSATTAQGNAAGALAAACKKVIALTGTMIGGYAEHIRPLMFRLCPRSLVDEGLSWNEGMRFSELYGRIETTIRSNDGDGGDDNSMSRGSKRSKTKVVKPGIMPTLFGKHLLGNAVFLSLSEVADNLPELTETVTPVEPGDELAHWYSAVEKPLAEAIKEMLRNSGGRDKRLLGTMLQTLLSYPDHPYGWEQVGYYERPPSGGKGIFIPVCWPQNLDPSKLLPKEDELIRIIKDEVNRGRQCWVYVQYTDKRDVHERLYGILEKQGFRVGGLRASVTMAKREDWIAKHAPSLDVVISHPKLVETGLDLFDKGGKHNFPTLIFYETGYNLFTLRQAARRSWRIGQCKPCKVHYLYYAGTLQERAMELMGKKLTAAHAIEGKFSSEGLAAMAGDDGGSVEMALARSLEKRLDKGDAQRAWAKVASVIERQEEPVILPMPGVSRAERLARLRARLARVDVEGLRKQGVGAN